MGVPGRRRNRGSYRSPMQIAKVAAAVLVILMIGLAVRAQQPAQPSAPARAPMSANYACPMRCEGDKTYGEPGRCPVCKMKLKEVPGESSALKLGLDMTKPTASELQPARPTSLVLKLTNTEKSSTPVAGRGSDGNCCTRIRRERGSLLVCPRAQQRRFR